MVREPYLVLSHLGFGVVGVGTDYGRPIRHRSTCPLRSRCLRPGGEGGGDGGRVSFEEYVGYRQNLASSLLVTFEFPPTNLSLPDFIVDNCANPKKRWISYFPGSLSYRVVH